MNEESRTIANVSIDVPDLNSGVEFYCSVFGWKETSRPFPEMAVVDGNNVTVCIHFKAPGTKPTPSDVVRNYKRHWTPVHLDMHVEDFNATISKAIDAGATIEEKFEKPKPTAFCSDPFGNGFCIIGK